MRKLNIKLRCVGLLRCFIGDTSGATAIEYSLMIAGIGLAIMGAISSAGQAIKTTLWGSIVSALAAM